MLLSLLMATSLPKDSDPILLAWGQLPKTVFRLVEKEEEDLLGRQFSGSQGGFRLPLLRDSTFPNSFRQPAETLLRGIRRLVGKVKLYLS